MHLTTVLYFLVPLFITLTTTATPTKPDCYILSQSNNLFQNQKNFDPNSQLKNHGKSYDIMQEKKETMASRNQFVLKV